MRLTERPRPHWSVISDVHGAAGTSGWWQLVDGHALRGPWEAVELAWVPADGISGLHHHTRTHEIYLVVSGRAMFVRDGRSYPMTAGHVAVTRLGSTHGLRAAGPGGVVWLVAEVPAPQLRSDVRAPQRHAPQGGSMHDDPTPVDLRQVGTLDLASAHVPPLRAVGAVTLDAGESWPVDCATGEMFTYLVTGSVVITAAGATHPVDAGTGVTFTLGEHAEVTAHQRSELFWIRVDVDEATT